MAAIRHISPKSGIFIILLLGCCSCTFGFNILMSPYYGMGSHFVAGTKIAESLLTKGHNVTFLIGEAFAHRAEDPAYSNFSFQIFKHKAPKEEIVEIFGHFARNAFENFQTQFIKTLNEIVRHNIDDCLSVLRDDNLIDNIEGIDAMVIDLAWNCGLFLRNFLEGKTNSSRRIPLIAMTPTPNQFGSTFEWMTSPFNRAYQPEVHSGYTNRMTFLQRTANVLMNYHIQLIVKIIAKAWHRELHEETGQSYHNFDLLALYGSGDILLLNSHPAVEFPAPLSPNIKLVGGLTCRPASNLTQELEEFVQSSEEHGIIVFTLGTYMASITTTRPDIVAMFAEAFRKMPQKIVWQLKELPDWELPSNVKAMPWLPQNDLLGHPKTKVLLYQAGNNGFQEAAYHGVPIVAIPLHGDQPDVAARIEARGMGIRLDKQSLSSDVIHQALIEVINNPSYRKVAKEVSAIYRDQPRSGSDEAAYWIEHAIKFNGSYLRNPANELNFIQLHLLDVYAFLMAIVIVCLAAVFFFLRFCLSKFINLVRREKRIKSKNE